MIRHIYARILWIRGKVLCFLEIRKYIFVAPSSGTQSLPFIEVGGCTVMPYRRVDT